MRTLRILEYGIALVGLFVIACAGRGGQKALYRAQRPSWVGQTAPGYFEGVSRPKATEAEARDEALWNAKGQIIEYLGVRIDTETWDWIQERLKEGDRSSLETATEVKIRVVAKGVLFRVRPEDWYIELHGKQFVAHCWVPFSEKAHQAFVQEWITQAKAEVEVVYQEGVQQDRAVEIGGALERYVQVVRVVNETEDVIGIGWPGLFAPLKQFRGTAENRLARLFGRISLSLENSGQIGTVGRGLPRPLVARVRFRTEGAEVPLGGMPVSFRFLSGEGSLDEILYTDGEGTARCQVYRIEGCDGETQVGVVIGQADWKEWLGKGVAPPEGIFRVRCQPRPIRILVYVIEQILSEQSIPSIVEGRLAEALQEIGASVIAGEGDPIDEHNMQSVQAWARQQGADVVVFGTATSGAAHQVTANLFVCQARLQLRAMEVESGTALLAIEIPNERFKDTRGFGNTPDQAARAALALERMPEVYEEITQQLAAELR